MYKTEKVALVFEQKPDQVWFFDLRKVEEPESNILAQLVGEEPPKLEDPDTYDESTAASLGHLEHLSAE